MTVEELIMFLQKQPGDLLVAYELYSEQSILEAKDIEVKPCCEPRVDGWVENARPDKKTHKYLIFPGN